MTDLRRIGPWLALAACAAWCAWFSRGAPIDDAFITFRYAANLVAGHGLVFNPGERVEGYSNFLWTILIAAGLRLGIDPVVASRALGAGCALLAVAVTARALPRDDTAPSVTAIVAALLLGSSPVVGLWAVHGLETGLFTLLVAAGLREDVAAFEARRVPRWSSLWYALAALTRPEGPLLFVLSAGLGVAGAPRAWRSRAAVRWVAIFAALVGIHLAWRYAYYGELLPNTYHAKVGFSVATASRGLAYVGAFFLAPGGAGIAALAAVGTVLARRRAVVFLGIVVLGYLAAVCAEGGDAFGAHRFIVPILPALYLLAGAGAQALLERAGTAWRRLGIGAAVAVVAVLHGVEAFGPARLESVHGGRFSAGMRSVGEALARHFPPGTLVALNPAGAVPYYSGFPAIDMLGLTDRHIARVEVADIGAGQAGHEKGDGAYVLRRRPDIILLGNVAIVPSREAAARATRFYPVHRSERELLADPELRRSYRRATIPLADGSWLVFVRRTDVAEPSPVGEPPGG